MSLEIAQEIKRQLHALGLPVVWSWRADRWTALKPTKEVLGGLSFKVRGAKYQGLVQVELMPSDTYRVSIGKKVFNDIYCDELARLVDNQVETY